MAKFELKQVTGHMLIKGKPRKVGWPMDMLLMDGTQIATINRVPGAAIGLMGHAVLTEKDRQDLSAFLTSKREGKPPASIGSQFNKANYEFLDDEEDAEEEVGDE